MVMASQMQDAEVGDGTNFVVIFAGALLEGAEDILCLGITTSDIADGYEKAMDRVIEDYRDVQKVKDCLLSLVMTKQFGQEEFITDLIAKACVHFARAHSMLITFELVRS